MDEKTLVNLTPAQLAALLNRPPPHAFYLLGEDNLRVTTRNSQAGVTLEVRARVMELDGEIVPASDPHVPNTDRSSKTSVVLTPEGWLLGVEVVQTAGSPKIGQTFVVIEIVRGSSGAVTALQTLVAGYVSLVQPLAWPGGLLRPSTEGPGVISSITGTNPAAGAEVSQTVPTGARWRLLGADVSLVTSAAAPGREVVLTIDDGANIVAECLPGGTQAASLTRRYSFQKAGVKAAGVSATTNTGAIPDMLLEPGYRIRTVTTTLDVADDFGAPQLLVEEWIDG